MAGTVITFGGLEPKVLRPVSGPIGLSYDPGAKDEPNQRQLDPDTGCTT